MNKVLACLVMLFVTAQVSADGLPLKDKRYEGKVVIFDLTSAQKAAIERYRTCQLEGDKSMNQYTPYVFRLTPSQAAELRKRKGFSPRYFEVYETYRGYNDAGPHWNLALRFSESQIEVPLNLVISDKEAKKAEAEQGWLKKNPCFPNLSAFAPTRHSTQTRAKELAASRQMARAG